MTLVIAVLCTGAWVRSRVMTDVLAFPLGTRQQMVLLTDGRLFWWGATLPQLRWDVESGNPPIEQSMTELEEERAILQQANGTNFAEWIIPHWSFAVPLTFISVWLLLGIPKSRTST